MTTPPAPPLDDDQRRVLAALLGMQRQSWEQGVAGHAALDLGLGDLVPVLAHDAVTRQTPTGKLAEIDGAGTVNCASAAEVVLHQARAGGDGRLAAAYDRQVRWVREDCPRAADGTVFHLEGTREVWVDSVYMVVPFLVVAGHVEEAAAQLEGHRARLFDPASGLYAARYDEDAQQRTMGVHWGTGNGWVVAGVARALRHLGSGHDAFRRSAAEHARTVLDACLALRAEDGLFHDVLDDPSTFREANVGQMLAYGIATGVADGWLPGSYAETARSLVRTARDLVDEHGFVTQVCGAPHFDRQGTSAEAQAFFLLATAAVDRLS